MSQSIVSEKQNETRNERDGFDVERDQVKLVSDVLKLLKPDGTLYFSNNKRDFKLSNEISTQYRVKNITRETIPVDFHDQKIHHCFEITYNR